jgi:hypothetical protein
MLQFLSEWLARDPGGLGASLAQFVGHPAYGITQLRQDLERFAFLLAAATASNSSAPDREVLPASRAYAGPCGASTSFVLALPRCGRSTLTPAAAPALTGTYPGSQHTGRLSGGSITGQQ